jgi:beta-lactamase regulating signal transducer with metallopeptidase domain
MIVDVAFSTIEFCLNWLLQSSLLIGGGMVVGRILRKRGSAVESVVYRTTLVAVILCPLATWSLSSTGISGWSIEIFRPWSGQLANSGVSDTDQLALTNAAGISNAVLSHTISPTELGLDANERLAKTVSPNGSSQVALDAMHAMEAPATVASLPADESVSAFNSTSVFAIVATGIVASWLFVSCTLSIRLASAWRQITRLRRRAERADEATQLACQELSLTLGVSPPDVLRSPYLPSPCLTGLRRPAVLLPEEDHGISIREVITHELAHLRRHDCHWNLLRQIATAVFFFQPLLWLLSRRLEATAEEVCDDYVVDLGGDRHEYAHRLVNIAELSSAPIAAAGVGIVAFRSMLAKRVGRIMDTSRSLSTQVSNLLLVIVLVGGSLATTMTGLLGVPSSSTQAEGLLPREGASQELRSTQKERPAKPTSGEKNDGENAAETTLTPTQTRPEKINAVAINQNPKLPATALEMIEKLKQSGKFYTTWETRLDYVTEADLPQLIKLLDSKELCAFSVSSICSFPPQGRSSVGNEAAYLIESFRKRYYPTKLHSAQDPPDKAELKLWHSFWTHQKKWAKEFGSIETFPDGSTFADLRLNELPDTVAELIETLKMSGNRYSAGFVRIDFVKDSDLPYLIGLLDSKEPCAIMDQSRSSIYYPGNSTVGHEAAYLIEGFWNHKYPTQLTSQRVEMDIPAIKRWYKTWRHLKQLAESTDSPATKGK